MPTKIINLAFSIIPISIILGNFALNLNIILIDLLVIFLFSKKNNLIGLKI